MQHKELEEQIHFLLSAALQKCGNLPDAEDLTQETLLCALSYLSKGKTIQDMRGWLLTVLSHKWNDLLRKKYRQPIISMGQVCGITGNSEDSSEIQKTEEARQVRQAIAYLAKTYREVIVRHYMNGESVAAIAASLGIPQGTVKRRLHTGRAQIKEGMKTMESYTKQSYQPVSLYISTSGNPGRNKEPQSLVNGDLLAQNILWAAYEKPLTADEIAKAIGTPTAYIEPIIDKLAHGELMKQVGNRYYTDFIIYPPEDKAKHIPAQKEFAKKHFNLLWGSIEKGLTELKTQDYYRRLTFDGKNSLEMYFAFNCLDYSIYDIVCGILGQWQNFPFRKDGGRWIAFGNVQTDSISPDMQKDLQMHQYTGERFTVYEGFANSKVLRQHVYSADGFPNDTYYASPDYTFLRDGDDIDDILTRLLYVLHTGIAPESVGFNTEYLKAIPHLKKCKILREENGRPKPNIPILNEAEFQQFCVLLTRVKQEMCRCGELKALFAEFLKGKKTACPAHIDSVPLFKLYMHAENAILFACIREALSRDKLYNGEYDEENQHPCPMLLVIA